MVLLWVGVSADPARAQADIRLDIREGSLSAALELLRAQSGVDVVYAQRLVSGVRVSCSYTGGQADEALGCLLQGTGIRADRVRRRQFVLVRDDPPPFEEARAEVPRASLAGFVSDARTGEMLTGAHVFLTELRLGTVTNDAGYFAIASLPRRAYEVRVSYLGYQTEVLRLAPDTVAISVQLSAVALSSDDVVVESDRSERLDFAITPGVVDVPMQRLETLPSFTGERDLLQALQWFPGVQRASELDGGLVVRGGEPDQNLYLVDGAPIYHPWHVFSLISTFQTETFRSVRLFRGAFPAEYGGRLSAVLDAQLKDGTRSRPTASAALSVLSGRFTIEAPLNSRSSFMLSGRRSYLDKLVGREHPVESDAGRRDTLRTGYHFYDASAKYSSRVGARDRFTATYYHGGDVLDLRLPFDLSFDWSSWLRPADLFFEIDQKWANRLLSLRYQHLASRRLFVTSGVYLSSYRAREAARLRPTSQSEVVSVYEVRLQDLGLRLDADYYPSATHQMHVGLQVVDRRFDSRLNALVQHSPSAIDTLDQRSFLHALELVAHAQDTWQPSPRFSLQPGVRLSFFGGGRYTRLDPRLTMQYTPVARRVVLRAGLGVQSQFLHRLRDRYAFLYDLVSSRWIPAGEDVAPSGAVQASLGVELHPASWLSLSTEVYGRRTKDLLLPEDVFRTKDGLVGPGIELGTLLAQYVPGEGRAFGVEASAQAERGPWQLWLNYAGGRSLTRAPSLGETSLRPARFDVPRSFRTVLQHTAPRWSAVAAVELRSGYPYSVPVARYVLGDPLGGTDEAPPSYLYRPSINNGRLPPYLRFDVGGARRFRLLGAECQVQLYLYNATSRRNVLDRQFDPRGTEVRVHDRLGFPLLPLVELEMRL